MPFYRVNLKGPAGVELVGPEEHIGENRYSWTGTIGPRGPNFQILPTLFLRIEKCRGIAKTSDHASPILKLYFNESHLVIGPGWLEAFERSEGSTMASLNPYTNELFGFPEILIPISMLTEGECLVEYHTDFRGDSISLKNGKKLILINISAMGLLDGLDSVNLDGKIMFNEIVVHEDSGRYSDSMLPFFWIRDTGTTDHHMREVFQWSSFRKASGFLLDPRCRNGSFHVFTTFLTSAMDVDDDRQPDSDGVRLQRNVEQVRSALAKTFQFVRIY